MDHQQPVSVSGAFQQLRALAAGRAFTLIELLVVIVVIGILTAVAAPSFLAQQDKAHDSTAKQALTVGYKAAKAEAASASDGCFGTKSSVRDALAVSEPQMTVATNNSLTGVTAEETLYVIEPTDCDDLRLAYKSKSGRVYTLNVAGRAAPVTVAYVDSAQNGSFETGAPGAAPAGWATLTSAGASFSTALVQNGWADTGVQSLRGTVSLPAGPETVSHAYVYRSASPAPVIGGRYTVAAAFNVLSAPAGSEVVVRSEYRGAGNVLLGASHAVGTGTGTKELSATGVIPAGTTNVIVGVGAWNRGGSPLSVDFYADSVTYGP